MSNETKKQTKTANKNTPRMAKQTKNEQPHSDVPKIDVTPQETTETPKQPKSKKTEPSVDVIAAFVKSWDANTTRTIDTCIFHCSATPAGVGFTSRDIEAWHLGRGFAGMGYHAVVLLDGSVELGRPIAVRGAHALGNNTGSIGICYIGGTLASKPHDTRTPAQKSTLLALAEFLKGKSVVLKGHRAVSTKECPCFDVKREYCQ